MGEEGMSAVSVSANAYRIKASHRRRRKIASGRRRQRYMDPQLGRFLSTDPVQANANTGASFNRYVYANNNPYKFTDPDGRQEEPAERVEEEFYEVRLRRLTSDPLMRSGSTVRNDPLCPRLPNEGGIPSVPSSLQSPRINPVQNFLDSRVNNVTAGGGAEISNLSAGDLNSIQNAADRSGQTITVVGSRAAGTAKPNSDWDYVVNANSKTRNNLSRSLPGSGNLKEGERPNIDVFSGQVDRTRPYIEVKPKP